MEVVYQNPGSLPLGENPRFCHGILTVMTQQWMIGIDAAGEKRILGASQDLLRYFSSLRGKIAKRCTVPVRKGTSSNEVYGLF